MKYRYSFQRDLIYKALKASKKHLTAEEIYKIVKKKHPEIGLGTIYRNLGILADMHKVMKLSLTDQALYEVDENPHHHLICKKCGKITNVYKPAHLKCVKCLSFVEDFKVDEAYINAFGYCSNCSKSL
ncbi:transcriptional repressor [Patescibacteria group bacterium]